MYTQKKFSFLGVVSFSKTWMLQGTLDSQQDEEDIDEVEEDDRDKFSDQLCSVGALGRVSVETSIATITRFVH